MKKRFLKKKIAAERFDTASVKQTGADIAQGFTSRDVGTYASSIAFFFFLSLIPILVLSSLLLPWLGLRQDDLIKAVTSVTPDILDHLISNIIWEAYNSTLHMVPVSVVILVWASSQGTLALIRGLNRIYHTNDQRNYFRLLLVSILYTIAMFIMLFFIVLLIFSHLINNAIRSAMPDSPFVISFMTTGRYFSAAVIVILIFMLIYTFVPAGSRNFLHQLPGALLTAVVWAIFSLIFRVYVNGANRYTSFYGSLGTIAIFLFWLFCCFYILLIGGFVNSHFEQHIKKLFNSDGGNPPSELKKP